MFIIGILANLLVICVLLLNKGSLKAPPGIYVFHLAFADSLLLISLPFAADNRLRGFLEIIRKKRTSKFYKFRFLEIWKVGL